MKDVCGRQFFEECYGTEYCYYVPDEQDLEYASFLQEQEEEYYRNYKPEDENWAFPPFDDDEYRLFDYDVYDYDEEE